MCCDFFYPRLGGVEMHIWSLSQCLLKLGHKVIIITHAVGGRKGIRYMTNGLKIYYVPMVPFVDNVVFPTLYVGFALFRTILIREQINIVHGHQATSTMMHECILQSRIMGYKTIYTDHSLFGFADAASVHLNKLMKYTMSDIDHAICVSHTCRENLVLRASVNPSSISAIPNAVDPSTFTPDLSKRPKDGTINIVIISRLVYRKGIDLVVKTIELITKKYSNVHFIIGGDGNKKLLLEEMREKYRLHDRVELLGALPHSKVRNVLCRGHIFLNSSLTESFCIAILEAVSCGLFVVSTRVGGVPEVLPSDMIEFSNDTTSEALADAISIAIPKISSINPHDFHQRIQKMYNWHDVAKRTQIVYDHVENDILVPSLAERFRRYYGAGQFFGLITCLITGWLYLYLQWLKWRQPKESIEIATNLSYKNFIQYHKKMKKTD